MDSDARRMLRFIRCSDLCKSGYCLFDAFYDAYCAETGWVRQRTMACMRQLEEMGYISYCEDAEGNHVGFELEHKAYHHRYYAWANFRDFLAKSILVPIIVAAITAYITLVINASGITNLPPAP